MAIRFSVIVFLEFVCVQQDCKPEIEGKERERENERKREGKRTNQEEQRKRTKEKER
ncbi:hypothetical protein K457DRAFT_142367 [Linnemannia elongata AG-77]|uniref:Uncharacterized protein n=1 Tax=Linnemannia elongata AG-77 TaxID=1314771 RepID=A0A197JH52_9FUNG|nr:hypothetical protein K457DRAFT_142367 [Linnemannia elongata AG-77]